MSALSAQQLLNKKKQGEKIAVMTAYDYAFAQVLDHSLIDMILVGDSAANVLWGFSSTRDIGMTEMLLSVGAVARGAPTKHVIADMPYHSDDNPGLALENAKIFMERGAHSVKLEGPKYDVVRHLHHHDIPVMAHVGLTPQTATSFQQVGKQREEAQRVYEEALELERAGAFAMVLEHIPDDLGERITHALSIPTIGIGAGKKCDGQVLVIHDALGVHNRKLPPFAHKFADVWNEALRGVEAFNQWVKE